METTIQTLGEIKNILEKEEEIIIYGAGEIAGCLLKYLASEGIEKNISCIAVKKIYENPCAIESIPVIELDCLGCFKKTGTFIIATSEFLVNDIEKDLLNFGCERIKKLSKSFLDDLLSNDVQKAVNNSLREKRIEQIYKRILNLEAKIEQQNEISHHHCEIFQRYKGIYRDQNLVLVGTAPSLNKYRPIESAIHIGLNRAWLRDDIYFEYLFTQDPGIKLSREELKKMHERVGKIFVGKFIRRIFKTYVDNMNDYITTDSKTERYYVDYTSDEDGRGVDIFFDICHHPLVDFSTVSFPALHFALYTQPRKLYIVGCDCTMCGAPGNHFYDTNRISTVVTSWKVGYARMKMFAKRYSPQTQIISINPFGLKGLFEDIYTE